MLVILSISRLFTSQLELGADVEPGVPVGWIAWFFRAGVIVVALMWSVDIVINQLHEVRRRTERRRFRKLQKRYSRHKYRPWI